MAHHLTHTDILAVRDASRRIVRNLGFMLPTLAETDLSPSAVHALIEIGAHAPLTANRLAQVLLLEKSSISRMLAKLIERELVTESPDESDGRAKNLSLTEKGLLTLADIDRFANLQVGRALHALSGPARASALEGLGAYAGALEMVRGDREVKSPVAQAEIVEGFLPGAIGRIAEMHGRYYSREWGFPAVFEAKVAAGLADFVPRLGRPGNQMWLAVRNGEVKGSIAVDGEDLGDGKAHLRWVIVEDDLRGTGAGRRLLEEALRFVDRMGFSETHLWTFNGLQAARKLYEAFGFVLAEEWTGSQWGTELMEQRFVRQRVG